MRLPDLWSMQVEIARGSHSLDDCNTVYCRHCCRRFPKGSHSQDDCTRSRCKLYSKVFPKGSHSRDDCTRFRCSHCNKVFTREATSKTTARCFAAPDVGDTSLTEATPRTTVPTSSADTVVRNSHMDLISATCIGVGFAREATSMERIQRLIAFTFYRLGCDQRFLKGAHSVLRLWHGPLLALFSAHSFPAFPGSWARMSRSL
jgi:hypothetical protein